MFLGIFPVSAKEDVRFFFQFLPVGRRQDAAIGEIWAEIDWRRGKGGFLDQIVENFLPTAGGNLLACGKLRETPVLPTYIPHYPPICPISTQYVDRGNRFFLHNLWKTCLENPIFP